MTNQAELMTKGKREKKMREERDRLLQGQRQGRYLHSRYAKRIDEITRQLDEAERQPGYDAYSEKILAFLTEHPSGVSTEELRAEFPKAKLRKMEKEDMTICYEDHRWHIVK